MTISPATIGPRCTVGSDVWRKPARMRGQEFADAERLFHIVVRAAVEGLDLEAKVDHHGVWTPQSDPKQAFLAAVCQLRVVAAGVHCGFHALELSG